MRTECKEILILGTVPPPVGGVSIHISRLLSVLKKDGFKYKYINMRQTKDIRYIFSLFKAWKNKENKIIHYQLNNWYECAIISFLLKNRSNDILFTVHSFSTQYNSFSLIKKCAYIFSCKKISVFIAPSKVIKDTLIINGIPENKIEVINTFISPTDNEKKADIPKELMRELIGDRKIVLASGSRLYRDSNGVDLYGLDMCIEACYRLGGKYKFVFCVPIIDDMAYYNQLCAQIQKYNIENDIFIYTKEVVLTSVYKYCNLFVRPTNSDSYGISIAEALESGKSALASNVCERANGCLLFQNRNVEEFCEKIDSILSQDVELDIKTEISCEEQLYKLYKKFGY